MFLNFDPVNTSAITVMVLQAPTNSLASSSLIEHKVECNPTHGHATASSLPFRTPQIHQPLDNMTCGAPL
jgi:hypothetical protein